MKVSVSICKKRLTILWLVGAAIIFLIMLFQTFFKHYSDAVEAWGWFLPTVLPTLSLMVGVLVTDELEKRPAEKRIDSFIFNLSFFLSIFYFMVVLLTLLMQPYIKKLPLEILKQSNLWLAPIQGLVAASLGAFFVKTG